MAKSNKTAAGVMLAAVIGGGAIGASAIPAMAADSTSGSSSTQSTDGSGTSGQRGPHQANGKTEEVLTGDTATKGRPGRTRRRPRRPGRHCHGWLHVQRLDPSGPWASPGHAQGSRCWRHSHPPGRPANEFSAAIPCFRVSG